MRDKLQGHGPSALRRPVYGRHQPAEMPAFLCPAPAARGGAGVLRAPPGSAGRYLFLTGGGRMRNPRYANGALRRKYRARFQAMGRPCGICKGKLGPIHYDEPSDAQHPLSFVIDEIRPISKWREFGYSSPRAAAEDWNNLQPAHYWCNAQKGNRTGNCVGKQLLFSVVRDGSW